MWHALAGYLVDDKKTRFHPFRKVGRKILFLFPRGSQLDEMDVIATLPFRSRALCNRSLASSMDKRIHGNYAPVESLLKTMCEDCMN